MNVSYIRLQRSSIGALLFVFLISFEEANAQINMRVGNGTQEDSSQQTSQTILPVDRRLSRSMVQAREAYQSGNWAVMFEHARRVLDSPTESFYETDKGEYLSTRREVIELLHALKPEERRLYESQFSTTADQQLKHAQDLHDLPAMMRIADRYPLTDAGRQAALYVAMGSFDQGRAVLAASILQDLAANPLTDGRILPQILLKLASAYAAAGDLKLAEETIERLQSKSRQAKVTVGGREVSLDDLKAMLETIHFADRKWNTQGAAAFLGIPNPNVRAEGSPPFLEASWHQPMIQQKNVDWSAWRLVVQSKQNSGQPPSPSTTPVLDRGKAFIKTLEGLSAVDVRTGKLVWRESTTRGRLSQTLEKLVRPQPGRPVNIHNTTQILMQLIQMYVFSNSIHFSMTVSDGRIFSVDELFAELNQTHPHAHLNFWNLIQSSQGNSLRAFDSEGGKLLWEINGASRVDGDTHPLDGVFFLGTPAAYDGQLFTMIDQGGELGLAVLEPSDGSLSAMIPLCLANGPARGAGHRAREACPVTISGGVVYCSTQYGRFFAVDPTSRKILWHYQYPSTLVGPTSRNIYAAMQMTGSRPDVSAPFILGRHLLFQPTDSAVLFCLNRITGSLIWKRDVPTMSHLACIHDGAALIVGDGAELIEVSSGESVATFASGLAVGRGVRLGDTYIYPLSRRRIARLDLNSHSFQSLESADWVNDEKAEQWPLGNFVAFGDWIVCGNPMGISAYPMTEGLQNGLDASIKKDGPSPTNLVSRAKIRLSRGDMSGGIGDLRNAMKLAGKVEQKEPARALLFRALLRLPMESGEFMGGLDEAKGLASTKDEQKMHLFALGKFHMHAGDVLKAMPLFRQYAQAGGNEFLRDPGNSGLYARSGIWLAARLREIWQNGSDKQREELTRQLKEEKSAPETPPDATMLGLSISGQIPGQESKWLDLARQLEEQKKFAEAEMILSRLASSSTPALREECLRRLAAMCRTAGLFEDADHFESKLPSKDSNEDGAASQAGPASSERIEFFDIKPGKLVNTTPVQRMVAMSATSLPYFKGMHVSWNHSTRKMTISNNDDKWDLSIPITSVANKPGQPQFRGYTGSFLYPTGHQLLIAWNTSLVCVSPAFKRVLWIKKPTEDWCPEPARLASSQRSNPSIFLNGGFRLNNSYYNYNMQRNAQLVGATSHSVLLLDSSNLVALDPIDGKTMWYRQLNGQPSQFFITEDLVCEMQPTPHLNAYRLSDGTLAISKKLPEFFKYTGFFYRDQYVGGTRIKSDAIQQDDQSKVTEQPIELTLASPVTGKERWRAIVPGTGSFFRASESALGFLQKNRVIILSLETGKRILDAGFANNGGVPYQVYSWASGKHFYVILPTQAGNMDALVTLPRVIHYYTNPQFGIRGKLLCFDMESNKFKWQKEYTNAKEHWMVLRAGMDDSPLVVLCQRTMGQVKRNNRTYNQVTGHLIRLLDAATGNIVIDHKADKNSYPSQLWERPGEITIRTNRGTLPITYKTRPKK